MKKRTIDLDFANQLYTDTENFIDSFGLIYTTDNILSIERKKEGKNFIYTKNGVPISSPDIIDRIHKLVIPPAWQQVRIANLHNAHLQAIGRDQKGRKQYKYHSNWNKLRNQTKFYKMYAFGKRLPKLRAQVELDLNIKKWSKTKVLALVIKLLEETHIRIGNAYYAKTNNTYGLSTLRSKHVEFYKDRLRFEFTGKRGKEHRVTLKNKKLIRLVEKCEEIPGWELFKFFDTDGSKQTIDSTMVNEYIQSISGQLFTAKDFRTWGASKICFETLNSMGISNKEDKAEKNILEALKTTSKALGNTRNVLKKYYVHPQILKSYRDNSIAPYFDPNRKSEISGLTDTESTMLELIGTYKPQL